jgi:hypothetical protein
MELTVFPLKRTTKLGLDLCLKVEDARVDERFEGPGWPKDIWHAKIPHTRKCKELALGLKRRGRRRRT